MQIHIEKHLKTLKRPWMKIKEVSEETIKGVILFSSPKTSYKKGNAKKTKKHTISHRKQHPCAHGMSHAPGHVKICLCSKPCAWGVLEVGQNWFFFLPLFKRFKPNFQPKFSWKLSYKYQASHSLFLIENEAVQENASTRSFRRSLSPHSKSLGCFYFYYNLFLVTMIN